MRLPYEAKEPDEATQTLAEKVVELVLNAKLSYEKTMEALDCAQRLIGSESRPVRL